MSVTYGAVAPVLVKMTWRALSLRKFAASWTLGAYVNAIKASCEAFQLGSIMVSVAFGSYGGVIWNLVSPPDLPFLKICKLWKKQKTKFYVFLKF